MERKLAHIEEIIDIQPIVGADRIEVATVLGWKCVIKKGEFKIGDKIIYIEVDSVVPERPEFEFLRDRKFRIRTIKLRKQISQGLIVPIPNDFISKRNIGDDVTDLMGIIKYLSPSEQNELQREQDKIKFEKNKLKKFMMRYSWFRRLFLSKNQKQRFPYWVSKTDEGRIQNMPQILEQYKDRQVYVTEKIDYQSVTFTGKMLPRFNGFLGKFSPKRYKFVVCSRNLINNDKNSLYWQIAKKYNLEEILKRNPKLTIQGEQGNTKVQGNKYSITEPNVWVFNIINHENDYVWNYQEMENFCRVVGLPIVPLLKDCKLSELGSTVNEIVEFSKGKSILANIHREGVVIRCIENGQKLLSLKAINPDFLLKYDN